ncbi:MAG: class I SAM-dependent methyltransferase family protein, partial [Candidatus Methanofastidiosia archaeon]
MKSEDFERIRMEMRLSKTQSKMLPRKYTKIGDVLILNIPDALSDFEKEIGKAYMKVFKAKSVLKKGRISGEFRKPNFKLIAGKKTETIHEENKILYKLDLKEIMFSSGNIKERIRMARLPKKERVIDMFAGIGYYSLPIAKFCKSKVYALEKNPIAYSYLCENIQLNKVENLITSQNIDCRDFKGSADRVIMGYLKKTRSFLPKAFEFVDEGFIIYHEAVPENLSHERSIERVRKIVKRFGRRFEFLDWRRIKKYSPGVW